MLKQCEICQGTGKTKFYNQRTNKWCKSLIDCPYCDGTGFKSYEEFISRMIKQKYYKETT